MTEELRSLIVNHDSLVEEVQQLKEINAELVKALETLMGKAYKQDFNEGYPEIMEECEAALAKAKGA
jgi:uncharacterized coiled-coil DUF342 family protein